MKKKVISLVLCVALLAVAVIGGTLAYFTDTTDTMQNTFTVGKVDIDIEETSPAKDGYQQGTATDNGFEYENILPNEKLSKLVVINVEEDSEDAYVYAKLTVKGYNELYAALTAAKLNATDFSALLLNKNLGTGEVIDAWQDDNGDFNIVYTNGVMEAKATWTLFDGIQVPQAFTQEIVAKLGEVELDVTGYAIQASEIADAKAGWTALGVHTAK